MVVLEAVANDVLVTPGFSFVKFLSLLWDGGMGSDVLLVGGNERNEVGEDRSRVHVFVVLILIYTPRSSAHLLLLRPLHRISILYLSQLLQAHSR